MNKKSESKPKSYYLKWFLIFYCLFPIATLQCMINFMREVTPFGIVTLVVNVTVIPIVAVCLALQIKLERKMKAESLNNAAKDTETISTEEQPTETKNGEEEQIPNSPDENKQE